MDTITRHKYDKIWMLTWQILQKDITWHKHNKEHVLFFIICWSKYMHSIYGQYGH